MWGSLIEELRRAGWRKVAVIVVAAALSVAFAYGVNSTNDAANGTSGATTASTAATLTSPAHKPPHKP